MYADFFDSISAGKRNEIFVILSKWYNNECGFIKHLGSN